MNGTAVPRRVTMAVVVLACLVPIVWPGDVPFINDEPQLVANALHANADGRLATMGLQGTYGFAYGPAPTWVYQGLLAVSRDLVVVSALHAALMSVLTAFGLWWIGRSLGLWSWFLPIPLLSPYFWFYARVLWDNTFLLPLSALALGGYAAFLANGSARGLKVSVGALLLIPLVHLMGLALLVPLGAHMLVVHGRILWRHRWSLLAMAAGVAIAALPYVRYLLGPRPASPPGDGTLTGWLFPLFGARLLSARGLDYFFGEGPVTGGIFTLATTLSALAYVLAWGGLAVSAALIVRAARSRTWTPRSHLAAIAFGALVIQSIIDGVASRYQHPHYQNGTWIVTVVFAWYAIDAVARWRTAGERTAGALTMGLGGALVLSVVGLAVQLHRTGGTREVYGPTLANQLQVARAMAAYDPGSEVEVQVSMWERFPHTPAVLRELSRRRQVQLRRRPLLVRYASADAASGVIELVER